MQTKLIAALVALILLVAGGWYVKHLISANATQAAELKQAQEDIKTWAARYSDAQREVARRDAILVENRREAERLRGEAEKLRRKLHDALKDHACASVVVPDEYAYGLFPSLPGAPTAPGVQGGIPGPPGANP